MEVTDLVNLIVDTPLLNLLILGGGFFILLAIIGRITEYITLPDTKSRILVGSLGGVFIVIGLAFHGLSASSPPDTSTSNSTQDIFQEKSIGTRLPSTNQFVTPVIKLLATGDALPLSTATETLTPTNTPTRRTATETPTPTSTTTVISDTVDLLFDYHAKIESKGSTTSINGAHLKLMVDKQPLYEATTNSDGEVQIAIQAEHLGQSGELVVDAPGYNQFRQIVDVTRASMPATIQLGKLLPDPTPTVRPEPSPTPAEEIKGKLAIPMKSGNEYKVYVTGFDGQGINGTRPVSLGNARQPVFHPNGQMILVSGTGGNFMEPFVTNLAGQFLRKINDRGGTRWPSWSPDGSEIIFADNSIGYKVLRQSSEGAFAGAEFAELRAYNNLIEVKKIIWSDDNRLVFQACATWKQQPGECGIWVSNADEMQPERILTSNALPMDAKKNILTYANVVNGSWEVFVMPLAGGETKNITNSPDIQEGLPAISPDGTAIAYIALDGLTTSLWTVDLNSLEKTEHFDIDPQRGGFVLEEWAEDRMSWSW